MGYKMRDNAPWFQFDNVGDSVAGTINREVTEIQSTDTNGNPVYWDDAKTRPKMVPVVTVTTDNGLEYAIGLGGHKWTAMVKALKDAGTDEIEEGGKLWMKFYAYSDQPPRFKNASKAKLYQAKYQAPPKGYKVSGASSAADASDPATPDDPWDGVGQDDEPPF